MRAACEPATPVTTMAACACSIVEDEPKMAALIARGLREEGHAADIAATGEDALWMVEAAAYDAILLDVMLPGLDGFAILPPRCATREVWAPVLMLTARDADRRPRRRARRRRRRLPDEAVLVRRAARAPAGDRATGPGERPTTIEVGDLRLDPAAHRAWRGETELELSTREFAVLELFMRRPGEVLSRLQLLDGAWDMAFESRSNVVDVYVRYLREKIDRPFGRESLETVRGVGYRLRADGGAA